MQIGKRVKELRESRKMTLSELSQKSGVQIATLSRIENNKMTGTLESHISIAKAFGMDLPLLYQDVTLGDKKSEPVTQPTMETFSYNASASYEILTNRLMAKKMMPIILRIDPGGKTNPEQNLPGSERFIFVLQGDITAHVGDKPYPLAGHQSLYFDASVKHYFENTDKTVAKVISVVTPMAL